MRLVCWLALVVALAPAANAQSRRSERLAVGPVALRLGMPEKPALAALARYFRVERARGAGDTWAVMRGADSTIAMISFRDGKLIRAAKTWDSTPGRDAATLAEQFYRLAGEFARQGRTQCTLSTKPYLADGVRGRIVALACGSKSIQLDRSRLSNGSFVTSLREVLQ
jgi:hypothetical protein